MSFQEDGIKDAIKAAGDLYKDNARISGLLDDICVGAPVPVSIVIFFSHNPIFTGATWAIMTPEHPAITAINTNERMHSPSQRF